MKKIPLIISLTASMSFGIALAAEAKAPVTQVQDSSESSPIAQGEGKCASGKCGSLKKFGVVDVDADEQDGKLVRARDGNCGTKVCKAYGKQDKKEIAQLGKCSNGVCGQ
ncbi:hypothetical protein FM755_02405 [Francisella tularensis]|uniref:Uncharacterized protein n=3 Tax=Francisella tularensis TaxID=263 RepID=A0AAI8BGZ2_FRATH|nr:hypothetical protein [Francisella tularensis]EBA52939.1 hypothetical protein FTHG_01349 [Francisella tularensis subsp. holarctica 257]ABI83222.1 conserved hypothetical protein [Francisella tularensis subsp. holarctica OSU18]ABU62001.1 conserved hypothetical protein [Francisella tularensis subsp. holarctica FTNF002-00]AFT93116.1 hypothetical protein FTS_1411 [Francisella tularensis subsp. holarctica FSC200]AJI51960.1 hypothetical protein DA46_1311 [Francisella tularensis subsp. holarctica]